VREKKAKAELTDAEKLEEDKVNSRVKPARHSQRAKQYQDRSGIAD